MKKGPIGRTFQICPSRSLQVLPEQVPPADCVGYTSARSRFWHPLGLLPSSESFPPSCHCFHVSPFQAQLSSDDLLLVDGPVLTKVFQPQTPLTFPNSSASFLGWCRAVAWLPSTQKPDPVCVWPLPWGQGTGLGLAEREL